MSFRTISSVIAVAALCVATLAQQQLAPPNRPEMVAPPQTRSKKQVQPPAKTPRTGKASARKVEQAPPQPPPPQPTPTLAQQPPVPPQVTYAGGLLTVNAPNSRLSDVISAVKRATGVGFDGATSDERVAVRLGPGSPHDVINALLHGSHLDYVIVGAENDPAGVQRVLLTAPSSGALSQPGTVVTQNGNVARPLPPNPNSPDPEVNNTDEVPDETVTEAPPENANVEGNPNNQDQENNQNNGEVQNNNEENQQQQPKTPQQLLQELQQLQQQQQQNIQNQQNQQQVPPGQPMPNTPNPNQPPPE